MTFWVMILQRIALVYFIVAMIEAFSTIGRPRIILNHGHISIFTAYGWQWCVSRKFLVLQKYHTPFTFHFALKTISTPHVKFFRKDVDMTDNKWKEYPHPPLSSSRCLCFSVFSHTPFFCRIGGFAALIIYIITTYALYVPDWSFSVLDDDQLQQHFTVKPHFWPKF